MIKKQFVLYLCIGIHVQHILCNQNTIRRTYSANKRQFPFQVSIQHYNSTKSNYGGAIVSNRWIVTGGYLWKEKKPPTIFVVVGAVALNSNSGTKYDIEKFIFHPNFHANHIINDIALIKTKHLIHFNQNVQPIKLVHHELENGTNVIASGYNKHTNHLEYWVTHFYPHEICKRIQRIIPEDYICVNDTFRHFELGALLTYKKSLLVGFMARKGVKPDRNVDRKNG